MMVIPLMVTGAPDIVDLNAAVFQVTSVMCAQGMAPALHRIPVTVMRAIPETNVRIVNDPFVIVQRFRGSGLIFFHHSMLDVHLVKQSARPLKNTV